MGVAALITWLLTATGGFAMLAIWLARGGARKPRTRAFPPAVIFGHFGLAATGVLVWVGYLVAGHPVLAWAALALLIPVALLGFVMFARWIPNRARALAGPAAAAVERRHASSQRQFLVAVVSGHGVCALLTVVLVLLTALSV